ncbi:MAG TPA: hypothetical protein VEI53_04745 [Ktedonobacteraceae bacterium]|nr:hypothetical protein [Ktedonobacteraceae bacterium]
MSTPDEACIQAALEQFDKDDLHALIRRMVQQHPDLAGLIVPGEQKAVKKPHEPFNAEVYRLQVEKIFLTTDRNTWGSEARAAGPLLDIVDVVDEYVEQQDFNNAATLYEIIIRGILDNYDSFRWHADEGRIDLALESLEVQKQTTDPRNGPYGSGNFEVGIEVAKAAEENYPRRAIEIYQRYVDTLIEWRGRDNYRTVSQHLLSVRRLYQQMSKSNEWAAYIADLRERNAKLPALRDEMAKAKL